MPPGGGAPSPRASPFPFGGRHDNSCRFAILVVSFLLEGPGTFELRLSAAHLTLNIAKPKKR